MLAVTASGQVASVQRPAILRLLHPIEVHFVTENPQPETSHMVISKQLTSLPPNVHLHTLRLIQDGSGLLREFQCDPLVSAFECQCELMGTPYGPATQSNATILLRLQHIYARDEDVTQSRPAAVDVVAWLSGLWRVVHMDEMTLTAGKVLNQNVSPVVVLRPMQIRTFLVVVD